MYEIISEFYPVLIILLIAIFFIGVLLHENKKYKSGAYYQITKNSYLSIIFDKGKYGEYLIYKNLKSLETEGAKFLFNIYIPADEVKTTEIDVLLICPQGLFVFESKNYSGWIFGNETNKKWTQVIYDYKNHFYNPIKQNSYHIKHLKNLIKKIVPMHSIVVFSNECTLKDITVKSNNVCVINYYNLYPLISKICNDTQDNFLTEIEISDIYNKLYPYTQVSYEGKIQHIKKISTKL